jgi:type IV secretory pathway TraG/TraD family ATPase VirD4
MKRERVLIIADEVGTYGQNMRVLEHFMGMGSGAALCQVMLIFQNVAQLRNMTAAWSTFIANCGVTLWFGLADPESRDMVSKLGGVCEEINHSINVSIDRNTGEPVVGGGGNPFGRPLILPHEAGELTDGDRMIVFAEGAHGPILAKRKPYWKVGKFRGKFRKNPYANDNRGGLLRRLVG